MKLFRNIAHANQLWRLCSRKYQKHAHNGGCRGVSSRRSALVGLVALLFQANPLTAAENQFSKSGVHDIVKDLTAQEVEVMYGDTLVLNENENRSFYFTHGDVHYRLDDSGIVQPFEIEIKQVRNGKKICGAFDGPVQCYQLFLGPTKSQKSEAVLVASVGAGKYSVIKGQLLDYRDTPFYDYEDTKVRHFYEKLLEAGETKAVVDSVKNSFEIYHSARWCADERYIEDSAMRLLEADIKSQVKTLVNPASKDLIWDAARAQNGIMGNFAVLGSEEQKYQLCEMVRGLLSGMRMSGDKPF